MRSRFLQVVCVVIGIGFLGISAGFAEEKAADHDFPESMPKGNVLLQKLRATVYAHRTHTYAGQANLLVFNHPGIRRLIAVRGTTPDGKGAYASLRFLEEGPLPEPRMIGDDAVYVFYLLEDYAEVLEALEQGGHTMFHYYKHAKDPVQGWSFYIETER